MFEETITPRKEPRLRFPAIFAGSIALHVVLLGLVFGAFVYRTAGRFALFSLEDGAEDANRYTVAMVNASKPLVLPPGFYAVKTVKPLEKVRDAERREKRKAPETPKAAKPRPGATDGDPAADAHESAPEEAPRFGVIRANALRPHLRAAFAAYEEGKIPDRPFRVTVTCKVRPDGSLSDIRLVQSSGNGMIDETALNLFREIGSMRALQPLATLSSLSLTLERGAGSSALSAVGFSGTESQAEDLVNQLTLGASLARYTMKNEDQRALLRQLQITRSGHRVAASINLPNSRAGEMMRRSFGSKPTA